MKAVLKSELNFKKTLTLISVLSAVFGIGLSLFGEFCLPLAAAALAVLYLYDIRSQKRLSLLISLAVVALNATITVILGGYSAVLAIEAVLLALVINVCYRKNTSKAEAALYATIIATVFLVLALAAIPIIAERSVSLDVIKDFYTEIYESLKQAFVNMFTEMYKNLGEDYAAMNITTADLEAVFERAAYMLISVVVIVGFAIAGFSLKLFSACVTRLDADTTRIVSWKFAMPALYAYFYMALTIINLFTSSSTGVFALAMTNLYNIFLYVYAYVGIKLIYGHFSAKHNRFVVALIIAAILSLSSSLAVQIFAMIGVFYSLYRSKIQRLNGD